MKLLSVTGTLKTFVKLEIIGSYEDDDHYGTAASIVADHFDRSKGAALAVVPKLADMWLDALNDLDTDIERGATEAHYALSKREARNLHRSASAMYTKILRAERA
jgi:hypothetical protein